MSVYSLRELGWSPFFAQQISVAESSDSIFGRVSAHLGSQIDLLTIDGEVAVSSQLACGDIAVGDWVLMEPTTYRFLRRLIRKTEIGRKAAGTAIQYQLIASNVDTLLIVGSCNQEFNLSRLERYLVLALESKANAVVVLTKSDLCDDAGKFRRATERLHPGLLVETMDARESAQVGWLSDWCGEGQTVALIGSSGVGKSTLANTLGVETLATNGVREADDRGRHTTTTRSLHRVSSGGWLLDTPGMRELQLTNCQEGVSELFDEILQLAKRCKFRDCSHRDDHGCAVIAAVEAGELEQRRLTNYLKLQSEQARNSQSLNERRQTERLFSRLSKKALSDKRASRDLH